MLRDWALLELPATASLRLYTLAANHIYGHWHKFRPVSALGRLPKNKHKIKNNAFIIVNLLYTTFMNLGYILLIIFAGFWVLSMFFGYIGGLSKTFS